MIGFHALQINEPLAESNIVLIDMVCGKLLQTPDFFLISWYTFGIKN
jgi:hypothetical protein